MGVPNLLTLANTFNDFFDTVNQIIREIGNTSHVLLIGNTSTATTNTTLNGRLLVTSVNVLNDVHVTGNAVVTNALTVANNVTVSNGLSVTNTLQVVRDATFSANVSASLFVGNGASLITLNASALETGTVPVLRLPMATATSTGAISTGTQTFGGTKTFVNAVVVGETLTVTGNTALTANLSVDGGTLFVHAVNNRVGVNTSNPAEALDVQGNVATSGSITAVGTVTGSGFSGSGASLSGLNASSITTGTLSADRIANASLSNAKLASSTISGVSLGGSLSSVTFTNSGSGGTSGLTYNGSGVATVSYNTIGAAATNQTMHIGTTAIAINRGSASQTLTGVNIDGTAGSISGFNNPTTAATGSTIAYRDSSGDITTRYFIQSGGNSENPTIGQIWTQSTSDNYVRKSTPAHFVNQLGLLTTSNYTSYTPSLTGGGASGNWNINITGNANYATAAGTASSASFATSATLASEWGTSSAGGHPNGVSIPRMYEFSKNVSLNSEPGNNDLWLRVRLTILDGEYQNQSFDVWLRARAAL